MTFQQFDTWEQVIAHVFDGSPIWYQAPLDVRPVEVVAHVIVKTAGKYTRKVRVVPPSLNADPFWADAGHLERFRFRADADDDEQPTRTKGDDDGQEYGDPRDYRDGKE